MSQKRLREIFSSLKAMRITHFEASAIIVFLSRPGVKDDFIDWLIDFSQEKDKKKFLENYSILKDDFVADKYLTEEDSSLFEQLLNTLVMRKHPTKDHEEVIDSYVKSIYEHARKFGFTADDITEPEKKHLIALLKQHPVLYWYMKLHAEPEIVLRYINVQELYVIPKNLYTTIEAVLYNEIKRGYTPSFLGTHFDVRHDSDIEQGNVTICRNLDEIPVNVLERVPELRESEHGYIVKKYRSGFSISYIDLHGVFPKAKSTDLTYYAKLLKERQTVHEDFFHKIPDCIVKSHFFIAKDKDGRFTIFEIQKNLGPHQSVATLVDKYFKMRTPLRDMLKNVSIDTVKELFSQVVTLIDLLSKLKTWDSIERFGGLPDMHMNNIAITADAKIKIFDTNFVNIVSEEHDVAGTVDARVTSLKTFYAQLGIYLKYREEEEPQQAAG
ncbi:hypothetical protein ACFL0V_02685 [Nanoarchaeota archaeon]